MNESIQIEIRFKREASAVSPEEIALLESILPELVLAIMQEAEPGEDD